jgi:hypothetical protein
MSDLFFRSPTLITFCLGVTLTAGMGCRKNKTKPTAEDQYQSWRKAIKNKRCKSLYGLIDEKSRWAVMSLVRDARAADDLIQKHYPKSRQRGALARVSPANETSPQEWLTHYCRTRNLMKPLAALGLSPKEKHKKGSRYRVVTTKGRELVFLRDKYGRWGCNALRKHLKREQIRMANILKITKENVSQFRQD